MTESNKLNIVDALTALFDSVSYPKFLGVFATCVYVILELPHYYFDFDKYVLYRMFFVDITYMYEGDSICNGIVPINQKVLYLYASKLCSEKDLLLNNTNEKSQFPSSFPTLHKLLSR